MDLVYLAAGLIDKSPLPQPVADNNALQNILTTIFVILGALAFLFIVIAGLRYILAGGDSQKVSTAKNQILYAAIGLVLAASAAAIVQFVLGQTA